MEEIGKCALHLLLQVIRTCHRQLTPEEEVAEEKVTTAVYKFMSSDTKESFAYL